MKHETCGQPGYSIAIAGSRWYCPTCRVVYVGAERVDLTNLTDAEAIDALKALRSRVLEAKRPS